MSWTCPTCSETYVDNTLIKCVCGYERIEEPEIISNECVSCGKELPHDETYCSSCDKSSTVISKKERKSIKTASRWILALCIIFAVMGTVMGLLKQGDERLIIFISNYFLAAVMLVLYFWGRRSPYPAIVTALCIYLALEALSAIVDPTLLLQGIIWKVFILGAFLSGIKSAKITRSAITSNNKETNPFKEKIRRYTIILFILSLLPYAMGIFGMYSSNKFGNIAVSLLKAEKLKYLEMDQYKNMNITTIEEFDKFWMSKGNKITLPKKTWIYFAITVILFIGLFLFQNWTLFGIIIYSLYNIGSSALWFSPEVSASTATLAGKVAQIATYLIILIYYARKKIRQVFITN